MPTSSAGFSDCRHRVAYSTQLCKDCTSAGFSTSFPPSYVFNPVPSVRALDEKLEIRVIYEYFDGIVTVTKAMGK